MSEAAVDSRRVRRAVQMWHPAWWLGMSAMSVLGLLLLRGAWTGSPQGIKLVGIGLCTGLAVCGCFALWGRRNADCILDDAVGRLLRSTRSDKLRHYTRSGSWLWTVGLWICITAAYFLQPATTNPLGLFVSALAALYAPSGLLYWSAKDLYQRLLLRVEL